MEYLRCVVERITYQNSQNGYSVIRCRAKGFQDLITVVGSVPEVHVGSVLRLGGSWRMDAKYGRQFEAEAFEETLPATVYGIEKYLGSGLVKGIGPKFAHRIVQRFGKDTLAVIEDSPERLMEVNGIGTQRVQMITRSWQEQKEIKNIMLFLQGHDVSTTHATKIYKTYGAGSIQVVQENPYRLADDIWGIGFRTADTIASKLGFAENRYERLRSGILYTLNRLADSGHCYATRSQLLKTAGELLAVSSALLADALDRMIEAHDLIIDSIPTGQVFGTSTGSSSAGQSNPDIAAVQDEALAIYLPPFYYAEVGTARRLRAIAEAPVIVRPDPVGMDARIARRTGMEYDEVQLQAIRTAVKSKVLVLTGGPGTGKTTTTLGIITAFREAGARILLAAPTGRAAKRLSEATGLEAKTIHRLLEMKPPEGFQKNEDNPLEGDILIVDECSMIDIMLAYSLLRAVPDTMTLILVGDTDQLPSVGAGNVLRDIIVSGSLPVVRLTRIFRQAQASRIITNAHRINHGQMPDISNGRRSDFFFIDVEKLVLQKGLASDDTAGLAQAAAEEMISLVQKKLPRYTRLPPASMQILTPMQRGIVGAANLNQLLQGALNPSSPGLRRGGIQYRRLDKVMQIRNNYEKEVYNGDIGVIEQVDPENRSLTVRFDDRLVEYDITELDELVLSYAATIHKSQGSEYPVVVMPVLMSHYVMLQRNLIYTGITRAKKLLVLVGTKKALSYAVRNTCVHTRNTLLCLRIQRELADSSGQVASAEVPAEAASVYTSQVQLKSRPYPQADKPAVSLLKAAEARNNPRLGKKIPKEQK